MPIKDAARMLRKFCGRIQRVIRSIDAARSSSTKIGFNLAGSMHFCNAELSRARQGIKQVRIGLSSRPTITHLNGDIYHKLNGVLHREDGPALISSGGSKHWYQNGSLHRIAGPAVERSNGDTEWWLCGERHRLNGPAIEHSDGYKEWWIKGRQYTEEEFLKKINF
jgi:hypothetical protein